MAHAWTYDTAASFWTRSHQDPEAAWDTYVSAERYLLDHRPRTPAEAAQILAVLVDQGGDRRSDGRDVEALSRVRRYLQQLARYEAEQTGGLVRAVAYGRRV
jgi:hypothetical protein